MLIKSIPRPEGMTEEQFTPAAEELFGRIMQMADSFKCTLGRCTLKKEAGGF